MSNSFSPQSATEERVGWLGLMTLHSCKRETLLPGLSRWHTFMLAAGSTDSTSTRLANALALPIAPRELNPSAARMFSLDPQPNTCALTTHV